MHEWSSRGSGSGRRRWLWPPAPAPDGSAHGGGAFDLPLVQQHCTRGLALLPRCHELVRECVVVHAVRGASSTSRSNTSPPFPNSFRVASPARKDSLAKKASSFFHKGSRIPFTCPPSPPHSAYIPPLSGSSGLKRCGWWYQRDCVG